MKRYLSRLLAIVLVFAIAMTGCSSNSAVGLSGDYRSDTLALLQNLRTAIELPEGTPDKAAAQAQARQTINDFASRYRRDSSVTKLSSFTTMRTALNSLAGHYSSYPNRPLPEKLKNRLEQEFQQVELSLRRGS
ncbi:photosystem II protein Psb27 [Trichocoleus sp. FACHB-90]|uniref:photosystem II protein Psb27 n=1 Tax=Cyanophyceae TaxID=3028117 RepID=UPI001689690B|nr:MULTISPECIES: photosystem II protein Psb27 [unclassified Trichocoleus]MBD1834423.1 photosystem II protein Psb27 [Cyanobacteria bacterium FACHB-472]MBD1927533.1 photosystem II protein Psb27 [Trichocoleus sp. FACHB-90]MBD2005816.1 photosystem II protein Psb27 [Trichocoleus sp. FACHB-40]